MRTPDRQNLLKNILFSAIIVILFFAALEILVRIAFDFDFSGERGGIEYEVDADTLWFNKPDQRVMHAADGVEYRFNSAGLRCADFPPEKPEGEIRLLIIGDSVTLGYRVTEEQAYPQMLQKYLDERFPKISFRVINGGVNAYSTREELMYLRKRGLAFEPDIVIVGFVLNDASLEMRKHYHDLFGKMKFGGTAEIQLTGLSALLRRSHFAMSLTRLSKMLRMRAGGQRESFQTLRTRHYEDLLAIEKREAMLGWDLALSELDAMSDLLDDSGIRLVVVGFPAKVQLDEVPTPDKPQRRLSEFCRSHDIRFVDLLPVFIEKKDPDIFLDRIHLTAAGYDLAARSIGESLIDQELW